VGICSAGTLTVRMDGGEETTISPGNAYTIPAGHDAWVVGDEPFVGYEIMSAAVFAKPA